jgi:hypothetical protein
MTETVARSEWVDDPAYLIINGVPLKTERLITHTDDWRETPFGRMNFGSVTLGPQRYKNPAEARLFG